jgi:hypothetical protein
MKEKLFSAFASLGNAVFAAVPGLRGRWSPRQRKAPASTLLPPWEGWSLR